MALFGGEDDLTTSLNLNTTGFDRGLTGVIAGLALLKSRLLGIAAIGAVPFAAMAGAMISSTKTAISFESAMAGVEKTVEGTPAQLESIKDEIIEISRETPIATEELFGIAEAAGQLGVETDNVGKFTKVMADMAATTELGARQAAMAFARFMNVMGTAQEDVERLGSVVVDLGNNLATTEPEIMDMATRMAGAAKVAGLAETDVLALAGAISSVGIRAQAGGSNMGKFLIAVKKATEEGGSKLKKFAEVSGMSVDEFVEKWENDPIEAVLAFTSGLAHLEESGGSATQVLDELGLNSVRMTRVLLGLASAEDLTRDSVDRANKAWDENNALQKEAETRYSTTASKMTTLGNKVRALSADLGEKLLPSFNKFLDALHDLLDGDIPGFFTNMGQAASEFWSVFVAGARKAFSKIAGLAADIDWNSVAEGLANAINNGVQRTADFFRNVDYGGVRDGVVGAISGAITVTATFFKTINWGELRDLILEAIGFAWSKTSEFFGNIDWSELAERAGDAIGEGFSRVNKFLKNIDWDSIKSRVREVGETLGESIRTFLVNINWEQVLRTLLLIPGTFWSLFLTRSEGTMGLIEGLFNRTLGNVDVSELIQNITDGFNNAVNDLTNWLGDVDTKPLTDALSNAFNEAVSRIGEAFRNIDWAAVGALLSTAFELAVGALIDFFRNIDWPQLVQTLIEALIGAVTAMINFLATVNWGSLLARLLETLLNIAVGMVEGLVRALLNPSNWIRLGEAIWNLALSINPQKFFEAMMNVDWVGLGTKIKDILLLIPTAVWNAFLSVDWHALQVVIWNVLKSLPLRFLETFIAVDWAGLAETVWSFVKAIPGWFLERMLSRDWSGFTDTVWSFVKAIPVRFLTRMLNRDWGGFTDTVWSFVKAIPVRFLKRMLNRDWAGFTNRVWSFVKAIPVRFLNRMLNRDWGGFTDRVWSFVKAIPGRFLTRMKNRNWKSFGTKIWNGIKGVPKKLIDKIIDLWNKGPAKIPGVPKINKSGGGKTFSNMKTSPAAQAKPSSSAGGGGGSSGGGGGTSSSSSSSSSGGGKSGITGGASMSASTASLFRGAAAGFEGLVNRPTAFIAGEKGPEHLVVRPLSGEGRGRHRGSGRGMTIKQLIIHASGEREGREAGKAFTRELRRRGL